MAKSHKDYPLFDWQALQSEYIIGVDEVGRGCLAGRVYAAAVVIDPKKDWSDFTDSKLISEKKRNELSDRIKKDHKYSIAFASVEEINQLNILHASLLAMKRAVEGLGLEYGHVLVDGNKTITDLAYSYEQTTLVKGDYRAAPIAAAAILAKVERDRYITELGEKYPKYGFSGHKAYATKEHKSAIAEWGPCEEHRKEFKGVKEFWKEPTL